ncbi:MAG: radical SAM protein [Clostridia bacterium]|nr:radical SAM protein [Clostridia bacterium]
MRLTRREERYRLKHLTQVCHTTLDPKQPGVVRIHLLPPREDGNQDTPYTVILNGQDILPITFTWAVLLSAFMEELNVFSGREIPDEAYEQLTRRTLERVKKVYPFVSKSRFRKDLYRILDTLIRIARGEEPREDVGTLSIFAYAPYMRAPHRMDLMVSAMTDEKGVWQCNQRCVHCYAAGQPLAGQRELTTEEWKRVIDRCRQACVAQLTFTGGEPTMRKDLVELIEYAGFFITRLNTNGALLTKELCGRLYEASLDSVQVTLYSADRDIHERLVGAKRYDETLAGIRNAVEAGLSVSVNTPLCALNRDYVGLLREVSAMGVRYFTCSGLIPTGGACTEASERLALDRDALLNILRQAFAYCGENGLEINFISPGILTEQELRTVGATQIPSCGAALSNMAVAPDGEVVPCQSWLGESLGNLLTEPFDRIWDCPRCRQIREESAKGEQVCQLRQGKEES